MFVWDIKQVLDFAKSTVMQIEKSLINDRSRISKVSWKFRIPIINNFVVIDTRNLLFFKKVAHLLTVSNAFFCL